MRRVWLLLPLALFFLAFVSLNVLAKPPYDPSMPKSEGKLYCLCEYQSGEGEMSDIWEGECKTTLANMKDCDKREVHSVSVCTSDDCKKPPTGYDEIRYVYFGHSARGKLNFWMSRQVEACVDSGCEKYLGTNTGCSTFWDLEKVYEKAEKLQDKLPENVTIRLRGNQCESNTFTRLLGTGYEDYCSYSMCTIVFTCEDISMDADYCNFGESCIMDRGSSGVCKLKDGTLTKKVCCKSEDDYQNFKGGEGEWIEGDSCDWAGRFCENKCEKSGCEYCTDQGDSEDGTLGGIARLSLYFYDVSCKMDNGKKDIRVKRVDSLTFDNLPHKEFTCGVWEEPMPLSCTPVKVLRANSEIDPKWGYIVDESFWPEDFDYGSQMKKGTWECDGDLPIFDETYEDDCTSEKHLFFNNGKDYKWSSIDITQKITERHVPVPKLPWGG